MNSVGVIVNSNSLNVINTKKDTNYDDIRLTIKTYLECSYTEKNLGNLARIFVVIRFF